MGRKETLFSHYKDYYFAFTRFPINHFFCYILPQSTHLIPLISYSPPLSHLSYILYYHIPHLLFPGTFPVTSLLSCHFSLCFSSFPRHSARIFLFSHLFPLTTLSCFFDYLTISYSSFCFSHQATSLNPYHALIS